MKGSVMVIGGGVAGLSSALELTSQGFKVVLVEKEASLGGRMTQLDKMFPTGDCGMCTILPKLMELTSNPNIQLMPFCEVKKVDGKPGDFKVTVLKKPRYVDWLKCNACTECFSVCPVGEVPIKFNYGKGSWKAINFHSPFPPRKAIIEPQYCAYLKTGKCGDGEKPPCVEACKPDAIRLDDAPAEIEVQVGAIINSTGLSVWHPEEIPRYGFGKFKNVVTGIDYERMLSGIGPTAGEIKRADGTSPKSVAFIQCVGPKEDMRRGNTYCSAVCCMAATTEAIGTLERDPSAKVTVFHNDIVAYAKNFQEHYRGAVEMGIEYVRAKVTSVDEKENGNLMVNYNLPDGGSEKQEVEMLVLSTNLVPNDESKELADILGVELDEHGFFSETDPVFDPVTTKREGIYLAGTAVGPKDISASIAQAAAASAMAMSFLKDAKGTETVKPQKPEELHVSPDDEPRIGVLLCHCGTNIANFVDLDELEEYSKSLPGVVVVERDLFACGGGKYKEMIEKNDLNRTVIGACSPKTHEHLFGLHGESVGLNKYLMEMVNLRNHCSWVHTKDKKAATEKSKTLINMGVARAKLLEPLHMMSSPVTQKALVVGGGISGLTCARRLGEMGYEVHLVDRNEKVGGKVSNLGSAFGSDESPGDFINSLAEEVRIHSNITMHTGTEITGVDGFIGQFDVGLKKDGSEERLAVGAIVIATGAKEMLPEGSYSFGEGSNIMTQGQLETKLKTKGIELSGDGHVVMISCVGAKEGGTDNPQTYCCNIGCENMLKNAKALLAMKPDARITIVHQDWNLPHKHGERIKCDVEGLENVEFIRYSEDKKPTVSSDLFVSVVSGDDGKTTEIKGDMVVLTTPPVAQGSNEIIKEMIGVCLEPNNFFMGALGKLKPLDFTTDGIFLCGTAHSPKGLSEAIYEGEGAASRVGTILTNENLAIEPTKSFVVDENCDGCAYCVDPCPANAITLIEYGWEDAVKKTVQVNEAVCKGCGICMATCPKDGIYVHHFKPKMFFEMIHAALGVTE